MVIPSTVVHLTAVPHHVPEGVPCPRHRGANPEQLCLEEPKYLPLLLPPRVGSGSRAGPHSCPGTAMMKGEKELVCALISELNLKTAVNRHSSSQDA